MAVEDSTTKRCAKCGETKPKTEFYKLRNDVQSYCKHCAKVCSAAWRSLNPERYKDYDTTYRKKWRAANPDKVKAAYTTWKAENPDKVRLINQNRRAQKSSSGKLSKNIAERLYRLQKGKCACCGLPLGDDYHMDHRMPLALGGTNTDDNMQLLRKLCNLQKNAKHPVDFMRSRGFLL